MRPLRPAAAALVLAAAFAAGCAQKPASVRVNPGKQTIYGMKRSRAVTAEVLDKKGEVMPGVIVEWSSSKPAVATVDKVTGSVKTVAPGRTIVTAKTGEISGTGLVDVVDAAEILVTPARLTLAGAKGTTAQLNCDVKDSSHKPIDVKATWSSSDPKVVVVDGTGLLRSVSEGKATITASIGDLGGGCDVAVTYREIGTLELAPITMILTKGETQPVRAIARDKNGVAVDDAAVGWSSSDPSIATCANGVVTGKTTGTATIRAICGSKTAELSVFVN
jgi:uncharacterized protein YjdB